MCSTKFINRIVRQAGVKDSKQCTGEEAESKSNYQAEDQGRLRTGRICEPGRGKEGRQQARRNPRQTG